MESTATDKQYSSCVTDPSHVFLIDSVFGLNSLLNSLQQPEVQVVLISVEESLVVGED